MRIAVAVAALLLGATSASALDLQLSGPCPVGTGLGDPVDAYIGEDGVRILDFGCTVTSPWRNEDGAHVASVSGCLSLGDDGEWHETDDTEVRYSKTELGAYKISFNRSGDAEVWPCE